MPSPRIKICVPFSPLFNCLAVLAAAAVIDNLNVVKEDGSGILHVPSQFLSMFEQELLSDLQSISGVVNLARTIFWKDITPSLHVSRLPMREVGGIKHLCMPRKMVYPDNTKSSIHRCWWSWFDHGHHAAASNGIVVCIKSKFIATMMCCCCWSLGP